MKNNFYIDTHAHISLYPLNLWGKNMEESKALKDGNQQENKLGLFLGLELPRFYTQSDLDSLEQGQAILVFASLYPIEQGFMELELNEGIGKKFIDNLKEVIGDSWVELLVSKIAHFSKDRVQKIRSKEHSYFEDLIVEYTMLKDGVSSNRYFIAENYEQIAEKLCLGADNRLSDFPKEIAVVLNLEGAHALGFAQNSKKQDDGRYEGDDKIVFRKVLNQELEPLWEGVSDRIKELKKWNVFSMNLAHHFWNQLCGHCLSLYNVNGKVLNQRYNMGQGITQLGWQVIEELLATNNGRRIYIDVKHMSTKSRNEYYKYLKDNKENVPIIFTHTAVNGMKDNESATAAMDLGFEDGEPDISKGNKQYKNSIFFNPWDINMSDKEICTIIDTDGLIGISFDERILMGQEMRTCLREYIETHKNIRAKSDVYYIEPWSEALIINIMHIVVVGLERKDMLQTTKQKRWEMVKNKISLSSDFDGFINPINGYPTTKHFSTNVLAKSLINRLKELKEGDKGVFFRYLESKANTNDKHLLLEKLSVEYEKYINILSTLQINISAFVEGICYRNTLCFLQTYFKKIETLNT